MKSTWLYVLAVVVLLAVVIGAYLAMPSAAPTKSEIDESRSRTTANGLYVAAIEPESPGMKQGELHSWILTVKTPDGKPVDDAKITVGGGMPDHNHGLPTSPEVTQYLGEGRYRIDGVKFSMSGWWELRFDISSAAGSDTVTFNLVM
ncbi:FixH family protein [Mesorhizobium sp. KR9-304]|uniref:FixH family protein n=1 Tax=Mesorhizobium sp. KR9-304 TaxID=3156614 RepID=UPI0032B623B6